MKSLSLLGSTGSIGKNVLEVVRQYPGRFRILGLAAGTNISLLRQQIEAFAPRVISVADGKLAGDLAMSLPAGWTDKIFTGDTGNIKVATIGDVDTVVSAIVGAAGLSPTYAAIQSGKNIALANKEVLVMAGDLVMKEIKKNNVQLLPIDSEHSAVAQALEAGQKNEVEKIILTASGGPFWNFSQKQLWDVTPEQALAHPNWNMGNKISIDSATMMNKGLEVIEARWLFNVAVEKIEVLIHPQSIVHSLVEFIDGSVVAQLGIPDMRIPISYALSYPNRLTTGLPRLNLAQCGNLTFQLPDFNKFPALKLAYQVCKRGGILPVALNAANEVAVASFLDKRIRFPEIALVVSETVSRTPSKTATNLSEIMDADLAARLQAESIIESLQLMMDQKKSSTASTHESSSINHSFTGNT
ncbi:MAG: 1-deoxy-D-xylulose-5-phosphate reductoisomerase [Proteobacteria bacterium]|nr:1-deoxy-D-xylulose-5-phosphate reductoisomerase [Pseudomonadota bacterium]MBU1710933.1 1-deoxy-D-xylulose-5-phosphate reductoisomerase [Pseudomonadota bacterium]